MPKTTSGLETVIPSHKNESRSQGRTYPTAETQNKKICVHHHILGVKRTPICYYREKGLSDPSYNLARSSGCIHQKVQFRKAKPTQKPLKKGKIGVRIPFKPNA